MVSAHCYNEIRDKVKKQVGEAAFDYIFPGVKKALEVGSRETKESLLFGWLDIDSCRICSICGDIMEEGWYLDSAGYACSDECAAKSEGITMDEFRKWRIYKDDIKAYLEAYEPGRKIEELSQQECDDIIDNFCDDCEYFYTQWY